VASEAEGKEITLRASRFFSKGVGKSILMCRFPVASMGVMAIGDRWAELISVTSAQRDEQAVAGQEHGILLINAGLQLVLVV